MGRLRSTVPRSRVPWPRRALLDPAAVRHWLLVAAAAGLVAALVGTTVQRAEQARRAWGQPVAVVVLTRDVERGDPLAGATRSVPWPRPLVPADRVVELDPGARAAADLGSGAPLTTALVDGPGDDRGGRTVAVPAPDARLPVEPGDVVDAWATRDPELAADGEPRTERVATAARVVAVADGTVVLAVPPSAVAELTAAAATATVALVGSS